MPDPVLKLLRRQDARRIALRQLDEALRSGLHVRARVDERPEVDAAAGHREAPGIGLEIEHAPLEIGRGRDHPLGLRTCPLLIADLHERDDQDDEDRADEHGEDGAREQQPTLKTSLHGLILC